MELEDVEALLWVARHGSLQAAARAQGLPRSTLRRRLDRLEGSVGAPLLVVHARGVELTAGGRTLVEQAPELLHQRDALLRRARGAQQPTQARIRVLLGEGFPPALTAMTVARLVDAHPGLEIDLRCLAHPLDDTAEPFDVAVFWGDAPTQREGYSRVMLRVPLRVMASPGYLAKRDRPATEADLASHEVLLHTSEADAWPRLGGGEVAVRATHRVSDLYVLGCMVAAGLGLGLIPPRGLGTHPSMDGLVPVLEDVIGAERTIRFFAPVPSRTGPAAALVRELEQIADAVAALSQD